MASITPDTLRTPGDLLREADKALYQAKSEGRNRVGRLGSTVSLLPTRSR